MKANKTSGFKRVIVLTALAAFILTATGCGGGHSGGGCGAYGNPKAPSTNSERMAE